ncbi:MAG: peptidyl-tRNA hydrolase [Candidatus Aenigmarchaeota archaeon]|nr:peptidyl-tRNA hydrolase [Candidatus Aenigmarchaeota archaeon]
MLKQAIVLRKDLKMGAGKASAQSAHASVAAFLKASEKDEWLSEGMKKVVLKVSSEQELRELFKEAKKAKLPATLIEDAGLTQLEPGTATALGIGPADEKLIDKLTGKLKLY